LLMGRVGNIMPNPLSANPYPSRRPGLGLHAGPASLAMRMSEPWFTHLFRRVGPQTRVKMKLCTSRESGAQTIAPLLPICQMARSFTRLATRLRRVSHCPRQVNLMPLYTSSVSSPPPSRIHCSVRFLTRKTLQLPHLSPQSTLPTQPHSATSFSPHNHECLPEHYDSCSPACHSEAASRWSFDLSPAC
jgi:hypothetical protein